MRKIIFFVVSFYSLMLLLVACGNGEDALYEQPRFSIRSDIQGVTRIPVLDGDGRGYFIEGDVNTVFFKIEMANCLKKFLTPMEIHIIGVIFNWKMRPMDCWFPLVILL